MGLIAILIVLVLLPAVIAYVLASMLPNLFPAASYRKRTLGAAAGAGCLPMSLPAVALLFVPVHTYSSTVLVPVFAVLIMALLIAVVVGLPVAILARRGKE